MFIIRCRISGGVTGTRESVLKDRNGVVQEFDTREAAQAEADRVTALTQGNKYRTADFRYWVDEVEYTEGWDRLMYRR